MSKRARIVKPLSASVPMRQHTLFRVGKDEIDVLVEDRGGVEVLRIRSKHRGLIVLPDYGNQIAILVGRSKA